MALRLELPEMPCRDCLLGLLSLAELPEGLVSWMCFALVQGLLHLGKHGCEVMIVVCKDRLVGCSSSGCIILGLRLSSGVGQPGLPQFALVVSLMEPLRSKLFVASLCHGVARTF